MGPKMRIISASYSAKQFSARSICDLVFAIGSDNPQEGPERPEHPDVSIHMMDFALDKEITSLQVESMGFIALATPHLQW
jgi:hypothetical protein